jgi:hypothetical protein
MTWIIHLSQRDANELIHELHEFYELYIYFSVFRI